MENNLEKFVAILKENDSIDRINFYPKAYAMDDITVTINSKSGISTEDFFKAIAKAVNEIMKEYGV